MNNGKRFELEIKNSIPSSVYYYRFRDGTANFSGDKNQNVRFQATNMCDCLLYDSKHLYFLELKTHKGKSLPLSAIRENQIEQLDKANNFEGVKAGFFINFRDISRTFYVPVNFIKAFKDTNTRKSIPVDFCEQFGFEIHGKKLRTNYRWDVEGWLNKNKNAG